MFDSSVIFNWLLYILWGIGALLLFSAAVIIHEFGHFIAAKAFGFKIDAFSIGFGPAIWHKTVNGCDYRISWIPLGGYVALPQLDPSGMDAIQGEHGDGEKEKPLPEIAAWKRMIVALAGPLGNIVLAVLIAFFVWFAPAENFGGIGTTIGTVKTGEASEAAGLKPGDKILSLNDEEVSFWYEVRVECHLGGNTNEGIRAVIERGGEKLEMTLPIEQDAVTGYRQIAGVSPRLKCQISDFLEDSAALEAGLEKGDEILAIDGTALNSPAEMVAKIKACGTNEMKMTVKSFSTGMKRDVRLAAKITEKYPDTPVIGIVFSNNESSVPQWMMYRRPWLQIKNDAGSVFRMLRALFAPKAKGEAGRAARDMGGAGTLFLLFWLQVQAGLLHSMAFLRFLCINLAIINLLPLPVLDGGHIMFSLYEIITRRKPPQRFVSIVSNVFAFLLIGLMALLLFRDFLRFGDYFGAKDKTESEPPAATAPAEP